MIFSVIVPVHNAGKYIEELLSSIDDQRKSLESALSGSEVSDPGFELLLMENGSTDDSAELCKNFAKAHSYAESFELGPVGAYNARREGIKKAKGDYLVFADADDILKAGALAAIYKAINGYGSAPDILIFNAGYVDDADKRKFSFPIEEGKLYTGAGLKVFYEIMCTNDSLNALWNKCIKRETALNALDDSPCSGLNHGEDLIQTAAFIDKASSVAFMDEILYLYRDNPEGLTSGYHEEMLRDQEKAWEAFDEYAGRWLGDKYDGIIDERKALTCSIVVKNLIYSMLSAGLKAERLDEIMADPFFIRYGQEKLPSWAPEEDVFIHGLIMRKDNKRALLRSGRKYKLKRAVKRILGYGD